MIPLPPNTSISRRAVESTESETTEPAVRGTDIETKLHRLGRLDALLGVWHSINNMPPYIAIMLGLFVGFVAYFIVCQTGAIFHIHDFLDKIFRR